MDQGFATYGCVSGLVKIKHLHLALRCLSLSEVSGDAVKPNDGVASSEIKYDADEEVAILSWDSPLPLGKAVLSMTFSGELNDKMKVLFASEYPFVSSIAS